MIRSARPAESSDLQSGRPGRLKAEHFQKLADVPPTMTWFANIDNTQTRRAYQADLGEFMAFTGIAQPEQFRSVTRSHLLAWRRDLERRSLAGATIRRKLAALSSLFDYLRPDKMTLAGRAVSAVPR